jgi:hypothetical protein
VEEIELFRKKGEGKAGGPFHGLCRTQGKRKKRIYSSQTLMFQQPDHLNLIKSIVLCNRKKNESLQPHQHLTLTLFLKAEAEHPLILRLDERVVILSARPSCTRTS